jgi:integrase
MLNGKARWMGLGPYPTFGLAEARARALDARQLRHDGVDPINQRRKTREQSRLDAARLTTFKACAEFFLADHRTKWKSAKHAAQWPSTLKEYAYPVIGGLPVQEIDTALVLKVLRPIWSTKTETASRLRGRIESVLDYATASGWRAGENPARWRRHLDRLLPSPAKVREVEHHPALPYTAIGEFAAKLHEQDGVAARALEFTILCAARTGETLGARWREIDFAEKMWTVPRERMKVKRPHKVPLSDRAILILQKMKPMDGEPTPDDFLFPGSKPSKPLSNMALLMLLRRMKRDDLTVHGFRSTFATWAAERTNFPREVRELALAHSVGNDTEAAYTRTDLATKRRRLMSAWAEFCATAPKQHLQHNIVRLRQAG